MIVCIDTNILIWGIRKEASPGQEDNILYAKHFLKTLHNRDNNIIIPTPVIAELFTPLPKEAYPKMHKKIAELGSICSFDLGASLKYASLFSSLSKKDRQKNNIELETTKSAMKIDLMILSIALVNKCEILYTNNVKDFKPWIVGQPIQILDMPRIPFEQDLNFPAM